VLQAQKENDDNTVLISTLENDLIDLAHEETELNAKIEAVKRRGQIALEALRANHITEVEFIKV